MAYDGSLIFDTKVDSKGFEKGVGGLKTAASTSMKVVGGLIAGAATAIVGIGVASIKVGSEFESGMSQVAATMGITVEEINNGSESFEMLEKAAKDMGKTTQFSATESSEALNYLALAGYDAEQAVATLPKVLDLAAAGGLDLAYTSDLITDSMSALGMEMGDLDGFVDQLAKTSQKSNTNVAQLGEAILTVGGTAKIMKGGTVELNTQLGILANAGIKGAEGGTALRNVLLALSAPTKKQAEQMKALGVDTYDAAGNLRSTDDIFQDLNGTLGEMTQEEKTQVLSNLFNKVDLKAANALLDGSGDMFGELSEEIANSKGAAADMAATLNDNLNGKMELLKSAAEGLGIEIYQGMELPLKQAAEKATEYMGQLSEAFEEGGFSGLVEELGNILADVFVLLADAAPQMMESATNMIMAFLTGISDNLPQITESALEMVQSFIMACLEILPELIVLGVDLVTNLVQGIAEMIPELIPLAVEAVMTIVNSIAESIPIILQAGVEILLALIDGIVEMLPELITTAIDLVLSLCDTIIENLPDIIDAGLDLLLALVQGIMDNLPKLIDKVPTIILKLIEAFKAKWPDILDTGLKMILELIKGFIKSIPSIIAAVPKLTKAFLTAFVGFDWVGLGSKVIKTLGGGIADMVSFIGGKATEIGNKVKTGISDIFKNAVQWGSDMVTKLGSGISSMFSNLGTIASDLASSALENIKSGFSGAFNIGADMVKGLWNGINSVKDWILGKISGFTSSIMSGIKGFFGIKSPSTLMRDEIGKNLALGLGVGIEREMPSLQKDIDKEMAKLTAQMKSTVDLETRNNSRLMVGNKGYGKGKETVTNNNDNGIVQNVTIVSPENTPSENARQIKKVGRELALGY